MSKSVRTIVCLLGILGIAAAAIVFIRSRSKNTHEHELPADLLKGVEEGEAALERRRALSDIRKVIEADPDEGLNRLEQFVEKHKGTGEASEAHILLALELEKRKRLDEAMAHLDGVIADARAGRRADRARIERARIFAATDPIAARKALEGVIHNRRHPDLQLSARLQLGLLDLKDDEFAKAIQTLKPLTTGSFPQTPAAVSAIRKAIVGQTLKLARGTDPKTVLDWGTRMVAEFPDLTNVHNVVRYHQATALCKLGDLVEARHILERLKRDVPAELLGPDIPCTAELSRINEAEDAAGTVRTRDAFRRARREGKEVRQNFEGDITSNTTWRRTASPIVLTDTTTVKPGATLTIEPGMAVEFLLGARLVVEGALVARGTADQPIRFTSAEAKKPTFFDGEGILFTDASDDAHSVLDHCILEYQRHGVACTAAAPSLRNCTFTRNGTAGLLATEGAALTLEGCRFISNDGVGIQADASDVTARRCLVLQNGLDGIRIAGRAKGLIENSRVSRNKGHGVACDNNASPTIKASQIAGNGGDGVHCNRFSQPTIDGSILRDNAGAGLHCLLDSAATVVGCLIEGNRDYPITLEKSDGVIKANNVVRNRPYGINCAASASPRIEGNWVEGNGKCGVICSEACAPVITGNAILRQERAISNTGALNVQATGNYFGDADDKQMEKIIFDKTDEKALGEIKWKPRLTKAPPRPPLPQLDLPPLP